MNSFNSDVNPFVNRIMDYTNFLIFADNAKSIIGSWAEFYKKPNTLINLDIGCGNGEFLFYQAKNNHNKIYLGIERQYKEIYRACKRISKLDNAKVLFMEAEKLVSCFNEGEIGDVCILFPDPWPKRKQTKHRLLNQDYILKLFKLMSFGSKLIIKTDNNNYFKEIFKNVFELKDETHFKILEFSRDMYVADVHDYINYKTSFERIFLSQGLAINYIVLEK